MVRASVFSRNCRVCHRQAGGVNLERYSSVKQTLSRFETAALTRTVMPPRGPLTIDDLENLSRWILTGAPINDREQLSGVMIGGPI